MSNEDNKGSFEYIRLGLSRDVLELLDEVRWNYRMDRSSLIRYLIFQGLIVERLVLDKDTREPIENPEVPEEMPDYFLLEGARLYVVQPHAEEYPGEAEIMSQLELENNNNK